MNSQPIKIGVLGGTFDPIHNGHIQIALEVKFKLGLSRVLFVPTYDPPHNKKPLASAEDRLKMVNFALINYPELICSSLEIERRGISYTAETLEVIKDNFNTSFDLFLIIGADNVSEIKNWHSPKKIFDLATIAVTLRPGYEDPLDNPDFSEGMIYLKTSLIDISSTRIRNNIKNGKTISDLVPSSVEGYIIKNKLYL